MTTKEALDQLYDWHHTAVKPEAAQKVANALGITAPVPEHAGRSESDAKGLRMKPGYEGSQIVAGSDLVIWVCDKLGVKYKSALGRGFQTQFCVEALRAHFNAEANET